MPTDTRHPKDTRGNKGNFANDPQRASEAGKKGGHRSHMKAESRGDQHAASVNSHNHRSSADETEAEDNEEM